MTERLGFFAVVMFVLGCLAAAVVAYSRIPDAPTALETVTVMRVDIVRRATLNGSVVPSERINVHAPVPLRVVKLRVELGQRVREGEVLAQLDRSSLEMDLVKREVAVARAELNLLKLELPDTLRSGGATQEAQLDRRLKDAELREARMELERVKRFLRASEMTSPKDGEVVGLAVREGDMAGSLGQGCRTGRRRAQVLLDGRLLWIHFDNNGDKNFSPSSCGQNAAYGRR